MRPDDNDQGSHTVVDLKPGKEIAQGHATLVPLTDTVKRMVKAMPVSQGIQELKFTNEHDATLAHHDWITGVDCGAIDNEEDVEQQN